jgi:hypothetical protein
MPRQDELSAWTNSIEIELKTIADNLRTASAIVVRFPPIKAAGIDFH